MKPWQKSNYYTPPPSAVEEKVEEKVEDVETAATAEGFVCDICGRTFKTKRGLMNHMRVHK